MPLALPRLHLPMHVPDLDALLGANHDQIVAVHRDLVQFATTDAHDLQALLHVDIPDLQATPVYRQRFGFSTAKNPLPFEASCTWTVLSNDNVTTKFSCGTNSTCEMPRSCRFPEHGHQQRRPTNVSDTGLFRRRRRASWHPPMYHGYVVMARSSCGRHTRMV